ncbi:MAG: tRNA (guanosine(37)-N1)-methyltransferase TrmD [Porticoccaceae bacterium]
MKIAVITLFPEMFEAVTEYGVSGRAVVRGTVELACFNPRQFTHDRHQTVDDRPYGGGPGMVMLAEPLSCAVSAAREWLQDCGLDAQQCPVVYLSPQGRVVDQALLQASSEWPGIIFIAGRYEGIDERFIEREVDFEWSVGDYVVSGGELPAMLVIDAMVRLLPGVLGHAQSAEQDSFSAGLLDCPHYTRPVEYLGKAVPEVLLSGDHKKIARWRTEQSLRRTALRRPELLDRLELTDEYQSLLKEMSAALVNEGKG